MRQTRPVRAKIAAASLSLLLAACSPTSRPSTLATGGAKAPAERPVASSAPARVGCVHTGSPSAQGSDAVMRLGNHLDEVARSVRSSATALQSTLLADSTLRVDSCGRPFYVDPPPSPSPSRPTTDIPAPAAALPYASTFRLHSRPGALRTIFIDFDGTRVEGTAWNAGHNEGQS